MADIVDDFLSRLAAHVPADLAQQLTPKLEAEIRREWGGTDRGYIRKSPAAATPRAKLSQRVSQVASGLQQGLSPSALFESAGIPRRTGYRILKLKPAR